MLGTGFALEWRLQHGRGMGQRSEILGMTRHEWGELHWWVGLGMAVLVAIHLAMHWKWIVRAIGKAKGQIGLVGLFIGLVALLLPLLAPMQER